MKLVKPQFELRQYTSTMSAEDIAELRAECENIGLFEAMLINHCTTYQPQILRREDTYREAALHHVHYLNEIKVEKETDYKVVIVALLSPDGYEEYGMFGDSLRQVYVAP